MTVTLPRQAEWRAWYFYDWANSAYATTVGTVLFAPYLISVAERSSCGWVGTDDNPCTTDLSLVGLHVSPGSLVFRLDGDCRHSLHVACAPAGAGQAALSRIQGPSRAE
jgi:hypothetical protein